MQNTFRGQFYQLENILLMIGETLFLLKNDVKSIIYFSLAGWYTSMYLVKW
jgi:hypothetical protein